MSLGIVFGVGRVRLLVFNRTLQQLNQTITPLHRHPKRSVTPLHMRLPEAVIVVSHDVLQSAREVLIASDIAIFAIEDPRVEGSSSAGFWVRIIRWRVADYGTIK